MRKQFITAFALLVSLMMSTTSVQAMTDTPSGQPALLLHDQYHFNKEITLPTGIAVPQIANFPRALRVELPIVIAQTPTLRDSYIVRNVGARLPIVQPPHRTVVRVSAAQNSQPGQIVIHASAYTAAADETGSGNGITASGARVQKDRTLACPPQYRFGTKVKIEGYGTYTCEDRGGAIKGNRFDIYMETKPEAFAFGRRRLVAYVTR